jgi:hypothetical protein
MTGPFPTKPDRGWQPTMTLPCMNYACDIKFYTRSCPRTHTLHRYCRLHNVHIESADVVSGEGRARLQGGVSDRRGLCRAGGWGAWLVSLPVACMWPRTPLVNDAAGLLPQ